MRLINLDSILKEANFIRSARIANALGGGATAAEGLTQRSDENLDSDPSYLTTGAGAIDMYQGLRGNSIQSGPRYLRGTIGPDFLTHTPAASAATSVASAPAARAATSVASAPAARAATSVARAPVATAVAGNSGKFLSTLGKAAPLLSKAAPLLKAVPFVGSGVSAMNAVNDFRKGDYTGAFLNAASGVAGLVPGAGSLVVSPLIDAANFGRQVYNNNSTRVQLNKEQQDASNIINGGPRQAAPVTPQQNSPASNSPVNIPPASLSANPQANQTKISMLMDKISSQFKQDLENPGAGTSSDLYSAIAPLISNPDNAPKNKSDAKRISDLQDNVRKGLVGLEYMTGLKRNEGETFYDEHPVQAVATDIASKALPLGATVAGGGILADMMRQWGNLKKTRPASDSREGNSKQNPTSSAQLLDPEKRSRPDISKIFGDYGDNVERRFSVLDRLNKSSGPGGFRDEYTQILNDNSLTPRMRESRIKDLIQRSKNTGAATALNSYADVHQSLEHAKTKGGLKGALGEKLQGLKGKGRIGDLLSKLAPGTYSEIGDLLEQNKITGANHYFDEDLIKDITSYNKGGGDFGPSDPKGKAFVDTTLSRLKDKKLQSSGLRKALNRYKLPLAAGGATVAGLGTLYGLLKLIQNQSYSNEKRKDWKKTLLKSRGEFEEADKIQ